MARALPHNVGRYDIFGEIASGGMASVYFARQGGPSGFSRTVAIKRAHPHLSRDPDFALMFLDEARLASRIRHPNVVSTIDVLQTPNDLALVMDYVHGESLWKLMQRLRDREERIPLPVAAAILVDTLHGLHAAHEATDEQGSPLGIVHRDVSPQNILVGTDGITRLVDFGIAKAAGRLHSTKDSSVKGKFAYMAPEQVRGEPVSRLTDTYAAAIVFWELVTGERLFVGKSDAETIHKCLVARARPPSMFHPDLPRAIDEIVKRGLSREPAKRYQTAREMALDIEACVPAIRPSEVGAWVERVAGDTLAARGRVLSDIERGLYEASTGGGASSPSEQTGARPSAATRIDAPASIRGSHGTLPPPPPPPVAPSVNDSRVPASVVAEAASSPGTAPHAGPLRRGVVVVAAIAVGIAMGLTLFFVEQRPRASVTPVPVTTTTPVEPAPTAVVATASEPAAPPPTGAAPAPAVPNPSNGAEAVATPPRRAARPAPPHRSKARSCDPPYSIDAEGREIFKPECM